MPDNSNISVPRASSAISTGRLIGLPALYRSESWGHFVQFYEDDAFLTETVAYLTAKALSVGNSSVLISSGSHLHSIEQRLARYGVELHRLGAEGRYVALDAEATLSRLMVNGWPDENIFSEIVGNLIRCSTENSGNQFVFGEMVGLLCAAGNPEPALRLEQLWSSLAAIYRFSLCCAYPLRSFENESGPDTLLRVCAEHSLALPAEVFF